MSEHEKANGGVAAAGAQSGCLRRWLTGPLRPLAAAGVAVLVMAALTVPFVGRVSDCGGRGRDASNVRQIVQASVIFASDHGDRLPVASDVWDYARQLALEGSLNDATLWFSTLDPACDVVGREKVVTVLTADRSGLASEFRVLKPSWAVTLGGLDWKMAPTTPVAWTRGLQADGTWAEHSPYGTAGGHVAFLGGEVKFFEKLTRRNGLVRFDGRGATVDIREALPPGVRIGEYVPTDIEAMAWAAENRRQMEASGGDDWGWETAGRFAFFSLLLVAVLTAVALGVVLARDAVRAAWRRRRGGGF